MEAAGLLLGIGRDTAREDGLTQAPLYRVRASNKTSIVVDTSRVYPKNDNADENKVDPRPIGCCNHPSAFQPIVQTNFEISPADLLSQNISSASQLFLHTPQESVCESYLLIPGMLLTVHLDLSRC